MFSEPTKGKYTYDVITTNGKAKPDRGFCTSGTS